MLKDIQSPQDLKGLTLCELQTVSQQIRDMIIDTLAMTGGHLASNLGIVELSVAMHYVFHAPFDKLIFDVSHQTYPHKLLTGRQGRFHTIRQFKGLCGFSHPKESVYDHFHAGHAGTALSLALGVARQRDLNAGQESILAIIGDASLTCGLTLEALNNIPKELKKFIVILNDNNMSISKNVGAISNILSRFFNNPTSNKIYSEIENILAKIPNIGSFLAKQGHKVTESLKNLVSTAPFFEQFGLSYVGPVDGHNLDELIKVLQALKDCERPTLLHVITTKGKGMDTAANNPISYHGVKPFDKITGKFHNSLASKETFPQVFGKCILSMADQDPSIVAITPAMTAGSCLDPFIQKYPERCIDVGIAEGHSVSFAGGMALGGKCKVVCSIYATFLQRALDNLFHDVCLQELPVVFAIDRAGISGPDGSTHHGIYDISFLQSMPNMVICQPRNATVLKELLLSAFAWQRPVAIRYPNLPAEHTDQPMRHRDMGSAEILREGKQVAIIALGHMCSTALDLAYRLESRGLCPTVIDPVFVKPLDAELLCRILSTHTHIVTIEEHSIHAGLGSTLNNFIIRNGFTSIAVANFGIPDAFLEHGSNQDLLEEIGLTGEKIYRQLVECYNYDKLFPEVDALL